VLDPLVASALKKVWPKFDGAKFWEKLVEERQRAKYSKEEKRLQAENATQVAANEVAAEKKARDAKTARLKELRLAKEREESNARKRPEGGI
jgi:hypothetical protein